jgi:hypothetical protein
MSDSESDVMSMDESNESNESIDESSEWKELEMQFEHITEIHQNALVHLESIQSQLRPQRELFEEVLEELHQNALKEIRETGKNPFGASLLLHFLEKSAQK